ncbi:MarR family transcriptional regulator [Streptomyces sp. SBT349]|uniref:MarR family transcriptional regulator n=1 Tax=Streptomyces sp. SBT349 TaxID=1580539 RepID=UPI00066CAFC4|nr:MarR family transcriptional regulator [Streptomyces sp. SBT349]
MTPKNTTSGERHPHPSTGTEKKPNAVRLVWKALTEHPGSTTAELALAAGVARSTTGKALAALRDNNLARHQPGERHGIQRQADRWYPNNPQPEPAPKAATATAENDTADAEAATPSVPAPRETPDNETATTEATAAVCEEGADEAADNATNEEAASPAVEEKKRLAPGELRQLVIGHLTAHPDEAFTSTGISRVIEKSSGAIANALVTLTKQGIAQQVNETPRRYQLATTTADADTAH